MLSSTRPSPERRPAAARHRDQLCHEYHPPARHLAHRYAHRGEPVDDLEQVATLALLKATDRFEPEREIKFSTYAAKVISGELKRHFRDRTWAMRVPRSLQELHLRTKTTVEQLRGDLALAHRGRGGGL